MNPEADSKSGQENVIQSKSSHSVALIFVIIFSFLMGGIGMFVSANLLAKKSSDPQFFPDITTQEASTCWEATVFATNNDPFYKWAISASMATSFMDSEGSTVINTEHATQAYQQASVWRVSGSKRNKKNEDESLLFNSPDPHLLGGVIKPHRTNWIWKMKINWGLNARLCLTSPDVGITCTYTAPIVSINTAAANSSTALGVLMVSVPYRTPTSDPYSEKEPPYSAYGSFLLNFASSARTNLSIGIGRKVVQMQEDWFYYSYDTVGKDKQLEECNPSVPVLYVPDIVSYLAFPSLQCGCALGVCIVAGNFTAKGLFNFSTPECQDSKTLWFWDSSKGNTSIIFQSYNTRYKDATTLQARYRYPVFQSESGFANNNSTLKTMKKLEMCVEKWLQETTEADLSDGLQLKCNQGKVIVSVLGFGHLETALFPRAISTLVMAKVARTQEENSITCGIEDGQARMDKICVIKQDNLHIAINASLRSFAKVADIHRFADDAWKAGASQRSDVYVAIMTTLLTLIITIVGMMSKKLQEGEDLVFKHAPKIKVWWEKIGVHNLRTLFRATIILSTTGSSIFSLYKSMQDITQEPKLATAGTIHQSSEGTMYLVTTTSTLEVAANWIVFYMFCSALGASLIVVIAFIHSIMLKQKDVKDPKDLDTDV